MADDGADDTTKPEARKALRLEPRKVGGEAPGASPAARRPAPAQQGERRPAEAPQPQRRPAEAAGPAAPAQPAPKPAEQAPARADAPAAPERQAPKPAARAPERDEDEDYAAHLLTAPEPDLGDDEDEDEDDRDGGAEGDQDGSAPKKTYEDPFGRRVTPRHKRIALRRARRAGMAPRNGDEALFMLAEAGQDVLDGETSILGMAERADSHHKADGAKTEAKADPRTDSKTDSKTGAKPAGKFEVKPLSEIKARGAADTETPNLPAKRPDDKQVSTERKKARPDPDEDRAGAIERIQRNLVRRRRRRLIGMALRLLVFVFLPTAAVGWYYFNIATPMYGTNSEFVIQTSDNPAAAGGGLGGLLAGTGFATSQDSIVVQGYLGSREAFMRLNADHGYVEHFQDPRIDDLQRLPADASLDKAYAYFLDKVTIGYDPTEGIIRMTVVAASPEASQTFAEALVAYAEERVDGLTQEARGDQLEIANQNYLEAETAVDDAALRVLELQQQRGVMSADVELQLQMNIISSLELEREQKQLELAELQSNARPNDARVETLQREISRLGERIADRRSELTQTSDNTTSLARVSGELGLAQADLEMRTMMLQQAVASRETARLEASRQVRYLSMGVAPVAPSEPTYPRKIEGTILAFLVFAGIYIMVSLTVAILREQVSV